jgi:hypothetical protein
MADAYPACYCRTARRVGLAFGALILMPAMLGMTEMIFVIGQMQWMSLMGHVIFTVIMALVFKALAERG